MDTKPDPELSPNQRSQVDKLSGSEVELIDSKLLELCSSHFQKVAKIVGTFMQRHSSVDKKLPAEFIASRVYALARMGALESQGNIGYMRYCEVRITTGSDKS